MNRDNSGKRASCQLFKWNWRRSECLYVCVCVYWSSFWGLQPTPTECLFYFCCRFSNSRSGFKGDFPLLSIGHLVSFLRLLSLLSGFINSCVQMKWWLSSFVSLNIRFIWNVRISEVNARAHPCLVLQCCKLKSIFHTIEYFVFSIEHILCAGFCCATVIR